MAIIIYVLGTIALCLIVLVLIYISKYNNLKSCRNQIDNALSSLDALFIKRTDLIPNLVAAIKQYTNYESDILEKLTSLRQHATNKNEYMDQGEADKLLKQVMIQLENYPDLKANTQFTNLQYSLNECEEQIAAGRRYLSSSITVYNDAVVTFPSNIVANTSGMKLYDWQRATTAQRDNVNIGELMK